METVGKETVYRMFVGGEWLECTVSGGTFEVTSPASGEVSATLPGARREEMSGAVGVAAAVRGGISG